MLRRHFLKGFLALQGAAVTTIMLPAAAWASGASGASEASAASEPSEPSEPSAASGPSDVSAPSLPSHPSLPSGPSVPSGAEASLSGAAASDPASQQQAILKVENALQGDGLEPVSSASLQQTLADFQ